MKCISKKEINELNGRTKYSIQFIRENDLLGKKILNIGCGFGWFENEIIQHNIDSIVGIEPREEDLQNAKENISHTSISFVAGSAIKIPFPSNYFDTVTCWEVLEHIPKNCEKIFFNEIKRVLTNKSDSRFYLSTPNNSFFSNILDPAYYFGHRHYSYSLLKIFADDAGFLIEKIRIKGGWYEVLSWWNHYVAKHVFKRDSFMKKQQSIIVDSEWQKKNGFTNIFLRLAPINNE